MPKETFINLPGEKRQRIIDIAMEEFSLNNYKSASLSSIVEKAGIAKGSMYQYFKNKKDLYLYLLNIAAQKKFSFLRDNLRWGEDFFQTLKALHLTGLKFDLTNPRYSGLLVLAAAEDDQDIQDFYGELIKQSDAFFLDLVEAGQAAGELRSDISRKLICFMLNRISLLVAEYLTVRYEFSYADLINYGFANLPLEMETIEEELSQIITLLREGFQIQR
ncbi:MAG: TetR/AcrR family transcriptional regulator [Halanaerobium sp.]|nr:TetR/AcrR family transcriptional regulator [Halanaerobium sp.]